MLIKLFILSIISGILYRLGGTSAGTKWRDLGVPTVFTAYILLLYPIFNFKIVIPYFLIFLLMMSALTSYRYFLPKPKDYLWYHYSLHGFFIGLSTLPLLLIGIHWYAICIYSVVLAILMGLWSKWMKKDILEEFGRGFLIISLLSILRW